MASLHSGLNLCNCTPFPQSRVLTSGNKKCFGLKVNGIFLNQSSPSLAMLVASSINSLVSSNLRVSNETVFLSKPYANMYDNSRLKLSIVWKKSNQPSLWKIVVQSGKISPQIVSIGSTRFVLPVFFHFLHYNPKLYTSSKIFKMVIATTKLVAKQIRNKQVYDFLIIFTRPAPCQWRPRLCQWFQYLVMELSWWWTMRYHIFDKCSKAFNTLLCNRHDLQPLHSIILPNENLTGMTMILATSHTPIIIITGFWICAIISVKKLPPISISNSHDSHQ